MSMRKSINQFSSSSSLNINNNTLQALLIRPNLAFRRHKISKRSVQCFSGRSLPAIGKIKRKWVVYNGDQPQPPAPSDPPPNALNWVAAIVLAMVIPFIGRKQGVLLLKQGVLFLKNKVETVLSEAEDVVEVVEKVAIVAEKVAEEISDDLPAGGKLRKAVDFVENLAERTAKGADMVDDFIDKVQGEEKELEPFVESFLHEEKPVAQKAEESDTKNLKDE